MAELRRNKEFVAGGYYHVYNHAIGNLTCFRDAQDHATFLRLIRARLVQTPPIDARGRPVTSFAAEIQLIAFCLMRNHFHMLIWQRQRHSMERFMRSLETAYVKRFNRRHGRTGQLFMHPYKARPVEPERLRDVASYIHLNPHEKGIDPFTYRYSSHRYYAGLATTDWCRSDIGVKLFGSRGGYLRHMFDQTAAPTAEPFD